MPWEPYTATIAEDGYFNDVSGALRSGVVRADTLDVAWSAQLPPLQEGDYVCWPNPYDRYTGPPHEVIRLATLAGGARTGIFFLQRGDLRSLPNKRLREVLGKAWPEDNYEPFRLPRRLVRSLQDLPWGSDQRV